LLNLKGAFLSQAFIRNGSLRALPVDLPTVAFTANAWQRMFHEYCLFRALKTHFRSPAKLHLRLKRD
jgi:hypothetical protein